MANRKIEIDGSSLTLQQVRLVATDLHSVELSASDREKVSRAGDALRAMAESDRAIYGVNTGFGAFADIRIGREQAAELSRNLILSHAAGIGPPFSEPTTRAAMLIRANTLAAGFSGVQPRLIDVILDMLNMRLTPCVPSLGSLGSSGDLAPLAHLALMIAEGIDSRHLASTQAWYNGRQMPGEDALYSAGLNRVPLGAKEGLALTNGASFSAALLALASIEAQALLLQSEIIAAMSYEALLGVSYALDDRLHAVRRHPGQRAVATRIRNLTQGSSLLDSGRQVQDPYSLRCLPQIHGPGHELLEFLSTTVSREINAATDNPLLFEDQALSGGNFHGEPLGLAADYLKLPLAEVAALCERRLFLLTSPHANRGLPPMLVADPKRAGLESGLMMLQYTAAALVLEVQALSSADSVRSLPTSAGQEDLNANSTTAGRRLHELLDALRHVMAIEWIAASQALDLRRQTDPSAHFGAGSEVALRCLRHHVQFQGEDRPLQPDINAATSALAAFEPLRDVEDALGPLSETHFH
jgi:histidine ammonia-lyase